MSKKAIRKQALNSAGRAALTRAGGIGATMALSSIGAMTGSKLITSAAAAVNVGSKWASRVVLAEGAVKSYDIYKKGKK